MKYYKEIRFRLTPEEKTALVALSEREDMSQSAYVRRLIWTEARKHGLWSSASEKRARPVTGADRMRRKIRVVG